MYGYTLTTPQGVELDSHWGMYGYEYEYAKQEAMDAADSYSAEEIRQADREEIEAKISALRDSLAAMNKEA